MHDSDEDIKLGSTDGKFLGSLLGNVDLITLGHDFGTDTGSLYGSFGSSNYGKIESLFLVDSHGYPYINVLGYNEVIKLGIFYSKMCGTLLGNVDCIILGIGVVTEMGSLD